MKQSEQVPTKDLSTQAENELICERLLGWSPLPLLKETSKQQWYTRVSAKPEFTPSFTTPDEGELIAQSLIARRLCIKMEYQPWDGTWVVRLQTPDQTIAAGEGDSWQQALRAAVVRFIDLVAYPWPSEPRCMHELRKKLLELPA